RQTDPTLAQNATNDLYDVASMSQNGLSFGGLTNKTELAEYVSGQDVSQSLRDSTTEYLKTAFQSKWSMPYDASNADYAKLIYHFNDPKRTQQLMDDRIMIKSWSGDNINESNIDNILESYNNSTMIDQTYDIPNMTLQEKCDAVLDVMNQYRSSAFSKGFNAQSLTDSIYKEGYACTNHELTGAPAYNAGEWVSTYGNYTSIEALRDDVQVDVNDMIYSFGPADQLLDARQTITDNRQDMLQNAIEDKYNLPDGSVDVTNPSTDVLSQVPQDSKEGLANSIIDSGAYIRDQTNPIPDDVKEVAIRTSVRDVVDAWINHGDTTPIEQTVGSLDLPQITGISGIGAVISMGLMYFAWRHRMHKLQKTFDDAREQVAQLEAQMDTAEQSCDDDAPVLQQKKGLFRHRK
ncbi:MAG: hypothetical protein IJU58_00645, partial [Clostridia bacterium]|nr:hypothetical protein [Clostridia bacterium]